MGWLVLDGQDGQSGIQDHQLAYLSSFSNSSSICFRVCLRVGYLLVNLAGSILCWGLILSTIQLELRTLFFLNCREGSSSSISMSVGFLFRLLIMSIKLSSSISSIDLLKILDVSEYLEEQCLFILFCQEILLTLWFSEEISERCSDMSALLEDESQSMMNALLSGSVLKLEQLRDSSNSGLMLSLSILRLSSLNFQHDALSLSIPQNNNNPPTPTSHYYVQTLRYRSVIKSSSFMQQNESIKHHDSCLVLLLIIIIIILQIITLNRDIIQWDQHLLSSDICVWVVECNYMEMSLQATIIENLKKTYTSTVKKERDDAGEVVRGMLVGDLGVGRVLCQMLTPALEQLDSNYMLIQQSITNFLAKYVDLLMGNREMMDQRREPLIKLFYEVLESSQIIHRHKIAIALCIGKLLIGTWGKENGLASQMFNNTIQVLQNGNFPLGVYLFQSMLCSCPQFNFPINVKKHLLELYMTQMNNYIKLCQQEMNEQKLGIERLQTVENGVEALIQYLTKVNVDRYLPLLKEIMKFSGINTFILSVFSLAPPGNSSLILAEDIVYSPNLNRLRLLSFSILQYFLQVIKTGNLKISNLSEVLEFDRLIFSIIVQKLPHQIGNITEKNENIVNKMLEFMMVLIMISDNYEFIEPIAEDILYSIAFPLCKIPSKEHDGMVDNPKQYLNFIDSMINEKKKKRNTITGNAIKLIDTLCNRVDGMLKTVVVLEISLLQYLIQPREQCLHSISPKLLNNPLFKQMEPAATFQTVLILLSSVAYLVSNRTDLLREIQNFLIRNELKLLDIKQKTIIVALSLFFCYYVFDIFLKKDLKGHLWTFFSYFLLLFKLKGEGNQVLRLQASETLQNIVQAPNFKSLFLQDIVEITDLLVKAEIVEMEESVSMFSTLVVEFKQTLAHTPERIYEWIEILEGRVNKQQEQEKSLEPLIKYLRMIEYIIGEDDFYMLRDQIMRFFSPCLQLLKTDSEVKDSVIDVISKYILASREVPEWMPQLADQIIEIVNEEGGFSESIFQLLNVILVYGDDQNKAQLLKLTQMIYNRLQPSQSNQDLIESVLLTHLIVFYHYKHLSQDAKSSLVNKVIRLILNSQINIHKQLFSKLILLILLMMKEEFQFTSLLLQTHNDFLHTFYNIAYNNSDTYVEEYDYKVFVIIQSSILDKNCHNPKQLEYIAQIFTLILEFLEKLYKTANSHFKIPAAINREYDYFNDSEDEDLEERIETQQETRRLMDLYITPLKQIDEWNNFKSMIGRMKGDKEKWDFISQVIDNLPPKQKNFFGNTALNIQKMNIGGETKVREIIKVKRPR